MPEEIGRDNRTMTNSDKTLLALVKSAVSGYSDELYFSYKNLTEIIAMLNTQAIPSLVVDGLQKYLSAHHECKPFADETAQEKLKRMQWLG